MKNDNGRRIKEICLNTKCNFVFVIANNNFRHKIIHMYTRVGVRRDEKFTIDHFLVDRRNVEL